jgi:hypothetical protein
MLDGYDTLVAGMSAYIRYQPRTDGVAPVRTSTLQQQVHISMLVARQTLAPIDHFHLDIPT